MGVAATISIGADDAAERKPFNGRCGACDHVWTVCYLPMALMLAAEIMKSARCPMCGDGEVFTAPIQEVGGSPGG